VILHRVSELIFVHYISINNSETLTFKLEAFRRTNKRRHLMTSGDSLFNHFAACPTRRSNDK
jgi:hypothetical protein